MSTDDVILDDVQCGRCGSSMGWEYCDGCDDCAYEYEDGDGMFEPTWRTCPACSGKGGWWQCLSDYGDHPTWCEGNPRIGRLRVPCSSVEEFTITKTGTTYKRGAWAELIDTTETP